MIIPPSLSPVSFMTMRYYFYPADNFQMQRGSIVLKLCSLDSVLVLSRRDSVSWTVVVTAPQLVGVMVSGLLVKSALLRAQVRFTG